DLAEYAPFSTALGRTKNSLIGKIGFVLRLLFSRRPPWPRLRAALKKKPDSPLRTWYWSQTPYALGPLEVKFALRPDLTLSAKPPSCRSKDRLREAVHFQLSNSEARFDFLVQTRTDPETMPIEDASVEWDASRAPFQKVATVRIPAQEFDFPAMWDFAENLSFTPWHSLEAHRPLGGINRARRVVYETLSARRHACNGQPRREPRPEEVPSHG
ncbi:MAG TPA: DUF1304 domain-containing protein, partial [Isosphaeraceae bacterium]|nr:DUF1304 domain-containing protein [Isosphaeraceae bacterium]